MAYFNCIDAKTEVAYELIAEPVQEPSQKKHNQEKSLIKLPKKPLTLLTCKASLGAYP